MEKNKQRDIVIKNGLKDIIFNSKDIKSKETALEIFVLLNEGQVGYYSIGNYNIPADVYEKVIRFMRQEKKIPAIKEIRDSLRISLLDAKNLVEEISFFEKIPMIKG